VFERAVPTEEDISNPPSLSLPTAQGRFALLPLAPKINQSIEYEIMRCVYAHADMSREGVSSFTFKDVDRGCLILSVEAYFSESRSKTMSLGR
jgi:hypothetical protein